MHIVGYHGTTERAAIEIEKTKRFNFSNSNKEWLGKGVYFYTHLRDAVLWCVEREYKEPVVLVADVEIEREKILDFTKRKNLRFFEAAKRVLFERGIVLSSGNIQENQCATMKYIWDIYTQYDMCIAEFPTYRNFFSTVLDSRPKRVEFCIRDNKYITKISRHKM